MEIKVISQTNDQGTKSCSQVTIVEGSEIDHRFIWYNNQKEFTKKSFDEADKLEGRYLGIPEGLWDENNQEQEGYFLFIRYSKNGILNYIICKNAEVYITNKGQTVDKVVVDY